MNILKLKISDGGQNITIYVDFILEKSLITFENGTRRDSRRPWVITNNWLDVNHVLYHPS